MVEQISLEPWPRPSTETVDWYLGGQGGTAWTPPGYLGWGKSGWLPEDRILRRFESSQSCRLNGSATCGKHEGGGQLARLAATSMIVKIWISVEDKYK